MNIGQVPHKYDYASMNNERFAELLRSEQNVAILLPVGAVEPHGPHLSLLTDVFISVGASVAAARKLRREGWFVLIAPAISYTVADCGKSFTGGISVSKPVFKAYLQEVAAGFVGQGISHLCLVNSHLEPDHDGALREVVEEAGAGVSLASPLTPRWARTLSGEFKKGACHAGQYETSLMLSAAPEFVDVDCAGGLPEVDVSLSEQLKSGVSCFQEMGMERSYAGRPADASNSEGEQLLEKLAEMIRTEVLEGGKCGS